MAKIITKVEQGSESYEIKDTVYGLATSSLAGLMSSGDKSKLDSMIATKVPVTMGSTQQKNTITISSASPSGGSSGDIWIKY